MNILELFAGSRSIGKVADKLGHNVFSIDKILFHKIDLVKDIMELKFQDIPFKPDMIWASPPCTTYSIAAISTHRNYQFPKTEFAEISDKLILKTLEIITCWYDNVFYYIENPVGMLRKMEFMQKLPRTTTTYCQYGDTRMKPTDIWSNNIRDLFNSKGWEPKSPCRNGSKCHESAPRGSKTGTQGLKTEYKRSKIPEQLCEEIIIATENRLKNE